MQTLPATIDENGLVQLLQPISLTAKHTALVTILDENVNGDATHQTESERLAAIDAAMGAMAHVPFSSDDLMRNKQDEKIAEDRRWN